MADKRWVAEIRSALDEVKFVKGIPVAQRSERWLDVYNHAAERLGVIVSKYDEEIRVLLDAAAPVPAE